MPFRGFLSKKCITLHKMHLNVKWNFSDCSHPLRHLINWWIALLCAGVIEADNWWMSEGCFNYCFTWLTHWLKTSSMMMCSIDHHRSSSTKWGNGGSLNQAMLLGIMHNDILRVQYHCVSECFLLVILH